MSKTFILKSADQSLSPSQVHLDRLSSGVFRDLFSSGSCGYNSLLQREEAKKSPKRSPYKRSKVKGGASLAKRKPASAAPKKAGGAEGRFYSGSSDAGLPSSARTKGPCTLRAAGTREAEGAKKLCILAAVKPANVESEKVKFFQSGFSYDPQFRYSNPAPPPVLARHNNASDRFLTQVSRRGRGENRGGGAGPR